MKTTAISEAMVEMLARLDRQAKAAAKTPAVDAEGVWHAHGYSADLWIGTYGAPTPTCDALLRRGLATEGKSNGFRTITINDAGREALALATLKAAKDARIAELEVEVSRLREADAIALSASETELAHERDVARAEVAELKVALSEEQAWARTVRAERDAARAELAKLREVVETLAERLRALLPPEGT